jgi:ABC-2 type transport system ATP-binding protein
VIEVKDLTKHYGDKVAVEGLSFTVEPGAVTGFLGPNGSGKSTTMRMVLGLDHPTRGVALVDGKPYAEHKAPLSALGALLDARSAHGGRTARAHLLALAATSGIPRSRVDEVLDLVGLSAVAAKRSKGFSLGMGQRLGIATALLGNPRTVMLDEPVNGLDPDGVLWVRHLLRDLARDGAAVLVSSHLMSEMSLTADHLVVIGRGRLIANESVTSFVDRALPRGVVVRSPEVQALKDALTQAGGAVSSTDDGAFRVDGLSVEDVGGALRDARVLIHELRAAKASLEEAFMELTAKEVEYVSHDAKPSTSSSSSTTGRPEHGAEQPATRQDEKEAVK